MIFTQPDILLESKPLRPRVEVFIKKGNTLVVGKPSNPKWSGFVIPGGGVDKGESLKKAAIREVLEELGVAIKNIKQINRTPKVIKYNKEVPKTATPHVQKYLKELIAKYDGMALTTFVADYDGEDKSLHGKELDAYQTLEPTKQEVLHWYKDFAAKMKREGDNYNHQKSLYVIEILRKI